MKASYLLQAIFDSAKAKQAEHFINILTMVKNPTAIPEHTSLVDAIRQELSLAAEQKDIIEALKDFRDAHIEDGIY
jgi:hypothetical protein